MPQARDIAIAVVERDGHYLIGRRAEGTVLSGFWEFPGGKVRAGEEWAAAAVRECQEETGLAVEVVGVLGEARHEYAHGAVHLRFFACRAGSNDATPREPFLWAPRARLREYRFPEANTALLARLLDSTAGAPESALGRTARDE